MLCRIFKAISTNFDGENDLKHFDHFIIKYEWLSIECSYLKIGANGNNHELLIKGESIKNYGEQKKSTTQVM